MKTAKREYYAKVPVINGFEDDYFWSGLDADTLTAAQFQASQNGWITEIGIWQETGLKVISAKNLKGNWEMTSEG